MKVIASPTWSHILNYESERESENQPLHKLDKRQAGKATRFRQRRQENRVFYKLE